MLAPFIRAFNSICCYEPSLLPSVVLSACKLATRRGAVIYSPNMQSVPSNPLVLAFSAPSPLTYFTSSFPAPSSLHLYSRPKYAHSRRVRACATPSAPRVPPDLASSIAAYISENPKASAEPSPLAYLTLAAYNRKDLIEPIMNAGGYIEVSLALSIPVDKAYSTYRAPLKASEIPSYFSPAVSSTSLAFGSSRESRASADISDLPRAGPIAPTEVPRRPGNNPGPAPVLSAAEVLSIGAGYVPIVDDPVPEGERLALDTPMRFSIILLTAAAAAGYGRASDGVLAQSVIDALRAASSVGVIAHVVLATYAAGVLAPKLGRSRTVWGAKCLLGGVAGIKALRVFGAIETDE